MPIRPVPLAIMVAAGIAGTALTLTLPRSESAQAAALPAPPPEAVKPTGRQVAVLAGGCFWGMEGVFEHVRGVVSVTSGYAGGDRAKANYDAVSSETTGHAEAVRIVYDPAKVTYGQLLQVYFGVAHDPTQVNGQYPDRGPSYRSAIFPQNDAQRQLAAAYIAALGKAHSFDKPIATKIENGTFFPAESWHQDFMRRNPGNGYIQRWDAPKVAALKTRFPQFYVG
ncbi:peptide-methionine (S)-S-oxide reductase [Novosphingobium sp. PhB165]|uniref:peptide-methionine (S)-S-oxide reductase MsrA n=1 Tax=Novosphingobium sp. PhB165 TaxID=2485105 RepID=UPI0010540DE1|nr:peptide-methionine (S)-S-oxide reductase MsrA [Novosphingobium sp. PhB165]TCM18128.1 peptide-methionine (S)-S-oxide reductase [Novosphingobium sp. PhB165]